MGFRRMGRPGLLGTAARTAVVVGTAEVMVRHQPPLMLPLSPVASSLTHRLHVPLGEAPLNALANVDVPAGAASDGEAGAGEGNVSPAPLSVGL